MRLLFAFSKSINIQCQPLIPSKDFCSFLIINICASVVPHPFIKSKCMPSFTTASHYSLASTTLSNIFSPCFIIFIPLSSHIPRCLLFHYAQVQWGSFSIPLVSSLLPTFCISVPTSNPRWCHCHSLPEKPQ